VNFDQPSEDTREFGPEHHICPDCGSDLVDDEHAVTCDRHPDFWTRPEPDVDPAWDADAE
jgi:hypothetical protein